MSSPDCAGLTGCWRWQWGWWLHLVCCCWQTCSCRSRRRCTCVCIYPCFGNRTSRCKKHETRSATQMEASPPQSQMKTSIDTSTDHLQLSVLSYCELWGKCSRCVMVTNGWFSVFMGVIRLSASSVSIFFSRSMNSRLSAFSARMSVPSRFVMFTCTGTGSLSEFLVHPMSSRQNSVKALHIQLEGGFKITSSSFNITSHCRRWPGMNPPSSPASYHPDSWRCTFLPPSTWCPSRPRAPQVSAEKRTAARPQRMCCKHTCDTISHTVLCVTHFEPPEGVARVGASVEKAAGFGSCAQQVLGWEALRLGDVTDLRDGNKTGGKESQETNVKTMWPTFLLGTTRGPGVSVSECHLRDSCEKLKCSQVTALVKLSRVLKHDL